MTAKYKIQFFFNKIKPFTDMMLLKDILVLEMETKRQHYFNHEFQKSFIRSSELQIATYFY